MASEEPHNPKPNPERNRLPFEPVSTKKLTGNKANGAKQAPVRSADKPKPSPAQARATVEETAIPQIVSQRMARRMAVFSGIPTALGLSTFVVCYWVVSHGWYKLPPVAVLLMSMGFFGLGVLGLSYGVLSASWDEEAVGSLLGWPEFITNVGRMTTAWRSAKQKD